MTKKDKHEKHYLRSDGNGGLNISHSVAIISIIVMIFIALIPAAVAWGVLTTKVDTYNDVIHNNVDTINQLEGKHVDNREDIAILSTQVNNIEDDVLEIKSDVKLLLTRS